MTAVFATWQGCVFVLGGVFIAGFLVGAWVFLGHGQARTTEDARNGLFMDRRAARGRRCTAVTARWCPLHGRCTCRRDDDGMDTDFDEYGFDDPSCALHGKTSLHGA